MDPQLEALLAQHHPFFAVLDNGKINCTLNNHSFPARYDALANFVRGGKYEKLRKQALAVNALELYEPFILKSKNFPQMLYCALTGQLLETSIDAIKRHMQGKKFQRASERFHQDQQELKPEPNIDDLLRNQNGRSTRTEGSDGDEEAMQPTNLTEEENSDDAISMDTDACEAGPQENGECTGSAPADPEPSSSHPVNLGVHTTDANGQDNNPAAKPRKQNFNRPSKSKKRRLQPAL